MGRILVTGATGFIGRHLTAVLGVGGYRVRAALRTNMPLPLGAHDGVVIGEIGSRTDWACALDDVEIVVHLAARTHVLRDSKDNEELYTNTNVSGTRRLALASAEHGVRRFVFMSSVKVNGEHTGEAAYKTTDAAAPVDIYGRSKWLAETVVTDVATRSLMDAVIVRSPLVYGPGVRANFLRLMNWIDRGWPLPLGAIRNSRSMVNVWNLCDFLKLVISAPAAASRVWMVSDGQDLSTLDLVRHIAEAMGKRARVVSAPPVLLRLAGHIVGRSDEVSRLCESLAIDLAETRELLKWQPPVLATEGIARTVEWYMNNKST